MSVIDCVTHGENANSSCWVRC